LVVASFLRTLTAFFIFAAAVFFVVALLGGLAQLFIFLPASSLWPAAFFG